MHSLLGEQAQFAGTQVFAGNAVFDFDQPGGVGVVRFACGCLRGDVGKRQVGGVVSFVFENPANHAERHGGVSAGFDGNPLPGFGGEFAQARVHNGEFMPVDNGVGGFRNALRGTVVGVEQVRANIDDELAVAGIALPVEFVAAIEGGFGGVPLGAHRLAGEVQRTLADSGVSVHVDRAIGFLHETVNEVFAPALHASPHEHELVVLRSQVGMFGVNQRVEVVFEFGLEFVRQFFFLFGVFLVPDGIHGGFHLVSNFGLGQRADGSHAFHIAFAKQVAAFDDFLDRLFK